MRSRESCLIWLDRHLALAVANKDSGSVTAELVLALPAVVMIVALALGAMSVQLHQQLLEQLLEVNQLRLLMLSFQNLASKLALKFKKSWELCV